MFETNPVPPTVGDIKPKPCMYCLDGDALESVIFSVDSGMVKEDCHLARALDLLHGADLRDHDTYEIGASFVKVDGDYRHLRILRDLIRLTRKGVKPLDATWFYYAGNSGKRLFFVVHSGVIVDDSYTFLNDHPLILGEGIGWAETDFGWFGHPGFVEAFECYWYKKFYDETLAGHLCVLSPDEPTLYHYLRRKDLDDVISTKVLHVRISCVALPVLSAIAFPSGRPYFAVLALLCAVPWIESCWRILKERG